jgi:mannosyltransferase OCH1-like enzyme
MVDIFIRTHRPSIADLYPRMCTIQKMDAFRYVALYVEGGVYVDEDVDPLVPVQDWPSTYVQSTLSLSTVRTCGTVHEKRQYDHGFGKFIHFRRDKENGFGSRSDKEK